MAWKLISNAHFASHRASDCVCVRDKTRLAGRANPITRGSSHTNGLLCDRNLSRRTRRLIQTATPQDALKQQRIPATTTTTTLQLSPDRLCAVWTRIRSDGLRRSASSSRALNYYRCHYFPFSCSLRSRGIAPATAHERAILSDVFCARARAH